MPISKHPLILPRDEPSKVLLESTPFIFSHSDMLPSNMPAIPSDTALPTTAPARAPTAPKSSAPIIAGIISNILSISPNMISGRIFFKLILKISLAENGVRVKEIEDMKDFFKS